MKWEIWGDNMGYEVGKIIRAILPKVWFWANITTIGRKNIYSLSPDVLNQSALGREQHSAFTVNPGEVWKPLNSIFANTPPC